MKRGDLIDPRKHFGEAVTALAARHSELVVLSADSSSGSGLSGFKSKYPDRHLEFGIMEQGVIAIAAGMATTGRLPVVATVLFAGGGVQGGRMIGASEPRGGGVQDRPVTPQDLLATLYSALGVPLDTHFDDTTGRPVSIVGEGQVIRELF